MTEKVIHIHDICQANNMNQADEDFIIQALHWPDEDDRYLFTSEFCKTASSIEHFPIAQKQRISRFSFIKESRETRFTTPRLDGGEVLYKSNCSSSGFVGGVPL